MQFQIKCPECGFRLNKYFGSKTDYDKILIIKCETSINAEGCGESFAIKVDFEPQISVFALVPHNPKR